MRSVTWIAPPIAVDILQQTKVESGEAAQEDPGRGPVQHHYTEEEKKSFRESPGELLAYRKELESKFNRMFEIFVSGSDASKTAKEFMKAEILRRIGPGHEDLKQKLIPTWSPGCRE